MKRLVLICFILILVTQISCSTTGPTQSAEQSPEPQLVLSLNGSGDPNVGVSTKTTQSFHISKGEWFIEATCTALDPTISVLLIASAYPKGALINDKNCIGTALQTSPGKEEINYIHGSGDFYLVISAMNVREWSIKVYQ